MKNNAPELWELLQKNVSGFEQTAMRTIAKRVGKIGRMTISDIMSINNAAIVQEDLEKILTLYEKTNRLAIGEAGRLYDSYFSSLYNGKRSLYNFRGKKFVPYAENKKLQSIVNAYAKATAQTMMNIGQTAAQSIGFGSGARFLPIGKFATQTIDKAVFAVQTGVSDFNAEMESAILAMGQSGVRVQYSSGVTRSIESVVRQTIMHGIKECTREYNDMIAEELGCDGIEVDWHTNPRPSHEFMQGKQFVLGKARIVNGVKYESADEALERLEDYNCYHFYDPIIIGVSEPVYTPEQLEALNKQNAQKYDVGGDMLTGYEVTQVMRQLESYIREQKTNAQLFRDAGNAEKVAICEEKARLAEERYRDITSKTGIHYESNRMKIFFKKAVDNDI